MKTLFLFIILLFSTSVFAQLGTAKVLTSASRTYDVVCFSEWLEVAVYDTGSADTILVSYPYTSTGGVTTYAVMGKIMDLSTGANVVGIYGDADTKYYTLWVAYPRAVRFTVSAHASGGVEIKATGKP